MLFRCRSPPEDPRRRPRTGTTRNKVQNAVLLSDREKVAVSTPRLPHNPPQIHHDLPPRNTPRNHKSPIKTPLHHKLFFWGNSMHVRCYILARRGWDGSVN